MFALQVELQFLIKLLTEVTVAKERAGEAGWCKANVVGA